MTTPDQSGRDQTSYALACGCTPGAAYYPTTHERDAAAIDHARHPGQVGTWTETHTTWPRPDPGTDLETLRDQILDGHLSIHDSTTTVPTWTPLAHLADPTGTDPADRSPAAEAAHTELGAHDADHALDLADTVDLGLDLTDDLGL